MKCRHLYAEERHTAAMWTSISKGQIPRRLLRFFQSKRTSVWTRVDTSEGLIDHGIRKPRPRWALAYRSSSPVRRVTGLSGSWLRVWLHPLWDSGCCSQDGVEHCNGTTPCRAGTRAPRARYTTQAVCRRGVVRHNPGLCVAYRRATIVPCPEALVASLRRTTIQRCRVPPGTAWRVDDAPQV